MTEDDEVSIPASTPVTVFWRPGCPYCWRLRTRLKLAGVHVDEVNIWESPDGAAIVRSVAGGDETVPTVRIGTTSLVNPSPRHVVKMIREARA
ncbi:MAG TPA: glutaredoxin domain-containing protein [Acidimicrobiales bacterium]|jgi:glutaredoxin